MSVIETIQSYLLSIFENPQELIESVFLYTPQSPMLFSKLNFWIFFIIVLTIFSLIYKKIPLRNIYLFAISLFFYYKTSGLFVLLLLFSLLINYLLGIEIFAAKDKSSKKLYLFLSIFFSLGFLFYYKYAYFSISILNYLLGTNIQVVDVLGELFNFWYDLHFNVSKILLPAGISFFTFQTISYTIDIYWNKLKPVRNISDLGFYAAFFPHVVAGPIVRASEFIPQIYREYKLSKQEFGYALFLILNGLIKKIVIADYLATNFIDRVFDNPAMFSGFENVMALIGYSLQVYCDFSGYTDIAIGVALLFGFKIPTNFNSPYKSQNTAEFWKRWHMSLSNWLKDYLYIPLGGNKHGKFRTNLNLLITMLIGGLWHGASIKFVIWGGLNGLGILVYKYWRKVSPYENINNWISRCWKVLLTFAFITFTRIFFRADNMDNANTMMSQIASATDLNIIMEILFSYKFVFSIMLIGFVVHWLPSSWKEFYRGYFINLPIASKVVVTVLVVFIIYQAHSSDLQPFIYFQF